MPGPSRSTLVASLAIALIVVVLGLRWLAREEVAAPGAGPITATQQATGGAGEAGATDTAAGGSDARGAGGSSGAGDPGEAALERAPAAILVVHVAGAVRRPGVYRLRDGARVADAVARAGGAARGADQAALNLAAKLVDGQQVLLPRRGAAPAGATSSGAASPPGTAAPSGTSSPGSGPAPGPISLASATLEQLDTLDGVGPVTAQKILDWRAKSGGFTSVDDLAQIPGIGPKKLESLRAQVVP